MRSSLTLLGALSLGLTACDSGQSVTDDDVTAEEKEATASAPDQPVEVTDAKVPGTDYHATAQIPCGFGGGEPSLSCDAGVIRNWGEDGTTLVEVSKPDGFKRAIFFRGTTPYGADSAEADGSAGWDFDISREGDRVTINFGPETYVVVDAFIEGG